ncbi:hypothetical protein C0Z20_28765 [Trinickia symbiotica]|uniref:Integrase catalytic domain-containing protein n=1 Tax=Trinickia symbiotica TaxID=863227 RepID=A0A2N7WPD4_9BURK|nr:hypothetical protein C0Z20_28765 [Trinickia symbiotica]
MDLYSRRIVGWSMSETMQARMVVDALLIALWRRGRPAELMHQSDQGSQYMSDDFQALLKSHGIACSMSRRGDCWDNAGWIASSARSRLSASVAASIARNDARAGVFRHDLSSQPIGRSVRRSKP